MMADTNNGKAMVITHWITKLIVVGILAMGAFPKFTGGAGALIEKLPGGAATAIAIGIAEVIAIVLILVPKTTLAGSVLAGLLMLGAVGSHIFGPVGMEGELGNMLPMAVIALLGATASGIIASKRGFALTPAGAPAQPAGI